MTAKFLHLVNCIILFQTQFLVASEPIGPYCFLLAKIEICVVGGTGEMRVLERKRLKGQLMIN